MWNPVPPNGDLRLLSDQELKITPVVGKPGRAVWDLGAVQGGIAGASPTKVVYTVRAQQQMHDRLGWNGENFLKFFSVLRPEHYEGSRWCYAPKGSTPHASDVYRMGFDRFKGVENVNFTPWAYVKFAMVGKDFDVLALFSAHPEGQYEGYE